jgi:hypothetical protein
MIFRRIFASTAVALLLSASTLAAACDLSCAFPSRISDCHSEQNEARNSPPGGMKMDGLTMPDMPDTSSMHQQSVFEPERTASNHARIGEMGPCEKQSCGDALVLAVKASHPKAAMSGVVHARSGFPLTASLPPASHNARDDLARFGQVVHVDLFSVSLRV